MKVLRLLALIAIGCHCGFDPVAGGDEVDDALAIIGRVGPNGAGAAQAQSARDLVAREGPEALPRILRALDTANVVAANYLRSAFDQIAARELDGPGAADKIPRASLEAFVRDASHRGRARRLALGLLGPDFRARMLADWLDDAVYASASIAPGRLLIRAERRLICVGTSP